MALYFRTWKMAVAGLVALLHDLVITVGIYALAGFEVTPASMIGFLTILGYSLYDTVVVFDKVRENTSEALRQRADDLLARRPTSRSTRPWSGRSTRPSSRCCRSRPILFVGFTLLGPGTLLDLSLALFVGIAVGAYSSIFIATPLLVDLRRKEPAVVELDKRGRPLPGTPRRRASRRPRRRARSPHEPPTPGAGAEAPAARPSPARPRRCRPRSHKYAQAGPRNQPKRAPKSKR